MTKPRNIVICLDGTGNKIQENLSNVLKLYRVLEKSDTQIVYYDQGVGTLGQIYTWGWLKQKIKSGLGLAFGLGLDRNVIRAYQFLVNHYQEHTVRGQTSPVRDNIFIFGFSRGAQTARVLAGMIYEIGILAPEQVHLSGAAFTAYKQASPPLNPDETIDEKLYEGEAANFRRVARTKVGAIKFLGVWDTVNSVFVPNPKGFFPPLTRENPPHTAINPAVKTFRQAVAVDEFRRMFRVDHWTPDQNFKPNIYAQGKPEPQNASEVWFVGSHGDVGGGYKRKQSGLSQFPLIWMMDEAKKSGLKLPNRMAKYVSGVKPWSVKTHYLYPEPDVKAPLHKSLTWMWWPLEIIPKSVKRREWPKRKSLFGLYIPWGEPRFIPKDANIHWSVKERISECPKYRPVNIPK
ncbi:MAG: DUF2235 domain-containing protein [Hyphomonadaceae bacterium]|nr:DUF2235 domain-containing protein [Hyphomonadaceae bacterium]